MNFAAELEGRIIKVTVVLNNGIIIILIVLKTIPYLLVQLCNLIMHDII